MLKLKKLKFSGIGRFVELQEIDFTSLSGLVQIDAINNNTNGSSGSGKSTVFNAIEFLLGINILSNTVLQSRLTKDHISVTGEFDWNGKNVIINRAKKLSILVDGIETAGSSKLSEELLDQILGLPRDLFRTLLHRRQNEQGFFLQLTPAKMNDFLADCTGVSVINNKIELVDEKHKALNNEYIQSKSNLEALQASLKTTQDAIESLGPEPLQESSEELIEQYKTLYESSKTASFLKEESHKEERSQLELKKPKLSIASFNRTYLDMLESEINTIEAQIKTALDAERARQNRVNQEIQTLKSDHNSKISNLKLENSKSSSVLKNKITELSHIIKRGEEARATALKIAGQLKILKSGICHTCEQTWITDNSKQEEARLLSELEKCKPLIANSTSANQEIEDCKKQYLILEETLINESSLLEAILSESLTALKEQANPQTPQELPILNAKSSNAHERRLEEKKKEDDHNKKQNFENQKSLESFLLEQKTLLAKQQQEIADLRTDLDNARAIYEQARNKNETYKKLLESYTYNKNSLSDKLQVIYQKVVQMNQKVDHVKEQLEIAEETKRCLKSYLSCSFDDALISISDNATRILRAVPTMANATIRLESLKESSSTGAIKEQINACLDNDGEIGVPIKSLSGGERSAVDLAIDLAVSELISERSKIGVNILLLDEVMNGFDTLGKEQAIEMLRTIPDRHILIIEHDPIAKELINDRITVIRDGEVSYLK